MLALGIASSAHASLIQKVPNPFNGTGHGDVATVLVIQQTGTESGCVAFNDITGTPACFGGVATGGDEKTGASQTQTRTIAESGATKASEFVIVFDANEPGGNSITLEKLAVRFYSSNGQELYTTSLAAPISFTNTGQGTGNSGFAFVLDATSVAAADAAQVFANPANVIGLSATLSSAAGAPDNFFVVGVAGADTSSSVPEPSTYLTLGAGLVAFGLFRKRSTR
jgi:hypothetical protein